jgi:LPXTG-site transpeptidase (sortase) family protein
MRFKISSKRLWLIVSLTAIVWLAILAIIIFFLTPSLPISDPYIKPNIKITSPIGSPTPKNLIEDKPVQSDQPVAFKEQAGLVFPTRLKIPKIKVDIALESVGLTPQGAMDVPKSLANAAWFNLGPRPGDNGSAVITGHYGFWKNGTLGVFNNLSKLRVGDEIYVENEEGSTTKFVVREFRTYGQSEEVPSIFSLSDEKAHLNLITCTGVWDEVSQSYPQRLVIFTDRE